MTEAVLPTTVRKDCYFFFAPLLGFPLCSWLSLFSLRLAGGLAQQHDSGEIFIHQDLARLRKPKVKALVAARQAPSRASLGLAGAGGFGHLCSQGLCPRERAQGIAAEPSGLGEARQPAGSCSVIGGSNQLPLMSEPG